MRISRADGRQHRELRSSRGVPYRLSAVLHRSEDFFVRHERVPPGRACSALHRHLRTEELVLVLSGRVRVLEGEASAELVAGDSALFEAGGPLHQVLNAHDEPAELLVVSRRLDGPDVVYG